MRLEIEGLNFAYGNNPVLNDICITVDEGMTSFIGPNAAGKSTLMKCTAGLFRSTGTITFGGHELLGIHDDTREVNMAYMPQGSPDRTTMTVIEVMLLGRLDSLRWKISDEDLNIAYKALTELGIEDLATRPMNELSGGQNQIVLVAQCLARDPKLMLMDEPMNNLDLQKQLEMFDLLERVTYERGMTTIMVLHDINFASRYSDNIVVMCNGEVYDSGTPEKVITEDMLREVYGVESRVTTNNDGVPQVEPLFSVRYGKRLKRGTADPVLSNTECNIPNIKRSEDVML